MRYIYNPEVSTIIYGSFHKTEDYTNYSCYPSCDSGYPPVDIIHAGKSISIWMELPGVKDNDLNVFFYKDMHGNNLFGICGIKRGTLPEAGSVFLRVERHKSFFCRFFLIENKVDMNTVKASLEDGVLNITWQFK